MATSGSKTVEIFSSWLDLKFSWWQTGQSVENNTTTIGWKMELISGNGALYVSGKAWDVTIDGVKKTGKANISLDKNSSVTLASGTATISHNGDGSKTFAYSFSQSFNLTLNNGNYMGSYSGSGSDTLTTIARASQPSCITWPEHTQNVGNFGDEISIHMNRKSSGFTHTVRYQFGTKSGTIATGVGTGTTWKIPLELMDLIPSTTSGSGTIYVDTYNGSTKVGTKYCGFTATVPASVKPTCSFTLDDITDIEDVYGSPVKGLSKIKVTVTGKTAYSSPIASYEIVANGVRYATSTATTGVLNTSGKSTVTAKVTDKRGRVGTASYDMNVQAYTPPVISALDVRRCNADGTANDDGEYVKATISAAVSSMNSKNTALYKLSYKKSTDSAYTTVSLAELANKYAVSNHEYIFAADSESSYDVMVTASDRHKTVTRSTSASTAFTLIDLHPSGNGLRLGGIAEEENTFQNDLKFKQTANSYCFQPVAFNGEKGYTLLAEISLNTLNVNAPIVFTINRRGEVSPMKLYIRFASSSTTTDPDLGSFKYEGSNYGAFLIKAATSTWRLYVDNTTGWSNPCVQEWYTTDNQNSRIAVSFPEEQIETLPQPWYRAGPFAPQNIMDTFFPVGHIMLLYSHADPNTMYPGTTWVRIYGAFPWFTDEKGQIGLTGGEREVSLTVQNLPAHDHGGTYTNAGTATKTHSWLASGGSAMTYEAVSVGDGEPHNNMPPYIQISAWRRTA